GLPVRSGARVLEVAQHERVLVRVAQLERHADALQQARRPLRRRVGGAGEVQLEVEDAALVRLALETDLAAQALDQALADGQAQAAATKTARGGSLGLAERLEQPALRLLRDADAGVFDAEGDAHDAVRAVLAVRTQQDAARLRELHRV